MTIDVKGFTGADIQAAIDSAKPTSPQDPPRVVRLPLGQYDVTEPIYIRHCVRLEFEGAWLKASGPAAIVVEGNAAQFTTLRYPWIYGSKLTFGIVVHASHVVIEAPMVDGAFVGMLLESGAGKRLAFPAADDSWYGCDHLRISNVAIWDCVTGIAARGADTNNVTITGFYGQTVTNLIYSETVGGMLISGVYHENGREADLSDDPRLFRGVDGGSAILVAPGSDGPRVLFSTSPGIVVGSGGAPIDGPHQGIAGAGLNQLQVTADDGQAGLLDGGIGTWTRRAGEAQLFGVYPSDGLPNLPNGWRCFGYGRSGYPGMMLRGERGEVARAGMTGDLSPAAMPGGALLGGMPLQSTVAVTAGSTPPDWEAVEGDWHVNTTLTRAQDGRFISYWRYVGGKWVACYGG